MKGLITAPALQPAGPGHPCPAAGSARARCLSFPNSKAPAQLRFYPQGDKKS